MIYRGFYIDDQGEAFDVYLDERHPTEYKKPIASYSSQQEAVDAIDEIMRSVPVVQIKHSVAGEWGDFISIKDETDLYYSLRMCDRTHHEFHGQFRIIGYIPGKSPRKIAIYPEAEAGPIY